ncbi:histone acetyltransferase subunit NuA4 [Ceratobasidium sp. AG-Ba]|nr:histone acetyltransferase subunit NuA4 [Ceratobasidium sp. AG-Ba]QRW06680.1 histone acetyltransferase subunit NuA4 [Ceratobasidium sp. AG-Ba]
MSTEAEGKAAYEAARKDLANALTKRKDIDKQLASLEAQIFSFESTYLTETINSGGNIIQGFENYLKHPNAANRKKYEVTDGDRLFSNSSATYNKSLGIHGDGERDADEVLTGSHVTVSLPAARQGSETRSIDMRRDRDPKLKKRTTNPQNEEGTPPPGNVRKKRRMASED